MTEFPVSLSRDLWLADELRQNPFGLDSEAEAETKESIRPLGNNAESSSKAVTTDVPSVKACNRWLLCLAYQILYHGGTPPDPGG